MFAVCIVDGCLFSVWGFAVIGSLGWCLCLSLMWVLGIVAGFGLCC